MSQYYMARKTTGLFNPVSTEPFYLSRSKIDLFMNCPRCFYLDRRLGISRPPGFPFSLNNAVDQLLKREFDTHRAAQTQHPLMKAYNLDALPFRHARLEEWRDSRKRGIRFVHKPTNLLIAGGVDDVWITPKDEILIVDYKATAKDGEVSLDADWQIGYKRQMEIYQWLFRQNSFTVSNTGYFVYVNGKADREAFDSKLEFDVKLIPYEGSHEWIEKTLTSIKTCLVDDRIPKCKSDCDYCAYVEALNGILIERHNKTKGTSKKTAQKEIKTIDKEDENKSDQSPARLFEL